MSTKIEWTDETWNPIRARNRETDGVGHFCEHASEGCRFCYAEARQPRFRNPVRFARQDRDKVEVFLDDKVLMQPRRWRAPRIVFPCSMTDLFGDWVTDAMLDRVFAEMAISPQHTHQVLTKRIERAHDYLADPETPRRIERIVGPLTCQLAWPLPNVWIGTSVEDQRNAQARVRVLLATPAAKRFLSCEPLIGEVDLINIRWHGSPAVICLDWVICGGESGHNGRPMHPDWARSLRDQCVPEVPFFFKQWGEWVPTDAVPGGDLGGDMRADRVRIVRAVGEPDGHFRKGDVLMRRVGKKAAGRLLDGRTWDEMPELRRAA